MRKLLLPLLLALGCGTQKPSALETLSLAATARAAAPSAVTGSFRVFNITTLRRSEWAPTGLPFAKGTLQTNGSVAIGTARFAFKPLERWNDGSVRRALVDYPAILESNQEITVAFGPSADPPTGGFFPAQPPMLVEAIVNGVAVPFDSWQQTFVNATRWEGLSSKSIGNATSGLTLDLYSTVWTGQRFGRVTLVVGNDWTNRTQATAFPVSDFKVRFSGAYAGPVFGWAHGITTVTQYSEFRLPFSGGAIGDGQRWGTAFTWADPQGPLEAAYAASLAPLYGYPEPQAEGASQAYGFYGRVKMAALGTSGDPYFTRQFWQTHRDYWLANCPNTAWTGHGFWVQQEGSTGGHADWSPAPALPDDLAMSPRGIHRMLQLSLSRTRTPDHYRIPSWNANPQAGCFNGWVNAPYREPSDYNEHLAGSNGWSGSDDAHREEHFRLRAYELTGEEHIRRELQATATLACMRAKPGTGYGEGRDCARTLVRKVIGYLTGSDAEREKILENLVPWAAHLNTTYPSLSTPTGPLYSLSILAPGMSKYGTHGFNPGGQRYSFGPFSEAHVPGSFAQSAQFLAIPSLTSAANKAGDTLSKMCASDGKIYDAMLEDGTLLLPRAGNLWYYPGLSRFEALPGCARAKGALEQLYMNSRNFDEIGWLQP